MTGKLPPTNQKKGKDSPSRWKSDIRECANCGSDMLLTRDGTYVFEPGVLARFREWECPVCSYFLTRFDRPEPPAQARRSDDIPF